MYTFDYDCHVYMVDLAYSYMGPKGEHLLVPLRSCLDLLLTSLPAAACISDPSRNDLVARVMRNAGQGSAGAWGK